MTSQQQSNDVDNGSANSSNQSENSGKPPLWNYVTKLDKQGTTGGTWSFRCNICKEIRKCSYSRVRSHLLGIKNSGIAICKKANTIQQAEMKKLEDVFEKKKSEFGLREVPLPCDSESSKKKKSALSHITTAFGVEVRDQLDQEIARMLYTAGLPFNLARNPHFIRSYQFAASNKIDGYVPPGYNKLRTTLLVQARNNVDKLMQPLKLTWKEKGVTIVSDGWSDPTRKPLINFMITSENGPIFLKAVNCFCEMKDKFIISNLIKEVINEVGHQNVVQIVTDNASNYKAAGEIIEGLFPHIDWTPCVVHTLNFAQKNICAAKNTEVNAETYEECYWITDIHEDALMIKNFMMNHNMRLSIFNKFPPLKLLSIADSHFASIIVMLKRFKLIKRSLQAMETSEEWSSYKEDDTWRAGAVKEKLLNDGWWDQMSYIVDFTRTIYDMIRFCDTDKPCLHLVYEMWDSMIEKVKVEIYKKEQRQPSEASPFYDVFYGGLVARWAKNNTPLHFVAHSLNPRFYSDTWLIEDPIRVGPHRDEEISREKMKCFRRLFPNADDHTKVMDEYASFSMKIGPFSDLTCISTMSTMKPINWWANFGAQTPILQGLAFKLLGQPSSSSCCERNWSTYSFIHSLRRNRLAPSRVEDLVFIHNNLRLLSRNSNEYKDERNKMWDVGGDTFDSMGDVRILEFADLSLDEPDLENELIID